MPSSNDFMRSDAAKRLAALPGKVKRADRRAVPNARFDGLLAESMKARQRTSSTGPSSDPSQASLGQSEDRSDVPPDFGDDTVSGLLGAVGIDNTEGRSQPALDARRSVTALSELTGALALRGGTAREVATVSNKRPRRQPVISPTLKRKSARTSEMHEVATDPGASSVTTPQLGVREASDLSSVDENADEFDKAVRLRNPKWTAGGDERRHLNPVEVLDGVQHRRLRAWWTHFHDRYPKHVPAWKQRTTNQCLGRKCITKGGACEWPEDKWACPETVNGKPRPRPCFRVAERGGCLYVEVLPREGDEDGYWTYWVEPF